MSWKSLRHRYSSHIVWVHPFVHIAPPRRLTRDAPSDELTRCSLARRGHSASAWQSCHDTQTWLTAASCCISEPSDVEDERNIRSKGWILGIFWLFREPRWQPFTERRLDNWAALLSVRQARRRLSIPESRIAGVDLREGFRGGVTQIPPPLFLYHMQLYMWSSATGFSRFPHLRAHERLTWITWMWQRDRLRPLQYSFWL